MRQIPVVDLRQFDGGTAAERAAFVARFGAALEEFGFVTLDHHGVDPAVVAEGFTAARRFFARSESVKRGCVVPGAEGNRGYVAFGGERAVGATLADLKEFFHVGQPDRPETSPASAYLDNVWPATDPGFRDASLALYAALETVSQRCLRAAAAYLGLDDDHFASMARQGNSILRVIHYPPVPADVPAGAVRAAAHEDINLMTLLVESTAGGLELLTREGEWIAVGALEGQIILDTGDMFARCTNGRIRATTHRVVNPTGPNVARYSMPFFVHPRPEVLLGPVAGTVDEAHPARFEPITADAFLNERLRAIRA